MCVEGQIFCLQASFWGGVWYHVTGGVLLLFVCVCVMCVGGWKDFPPNLSECLVCMQEMFSPSFFLMTQCVIQGKLGGGVFYCCLCVMCGGMDGFSSKFISVYMHELFSPSAFFGYGV